jgi:hypothetical protein
MNYIPDSTSPLLSLKMWNQQEKTFTIITHTARITEHGVTPTHHCKEKNISIPKIYNTTEHEHLTYNTFLSMHADGDHQVPALYGF